jgi:nucleoside phosphorylase
MIADLDPDWLVLTGIAGGIPHEDSSLGDVVLASRLHDFSLEAVFENKPPEFSNHGGPMHEMVKDRLSFLPAILLEINNWFERIDLDYPKVRLEDDNFYSDDPEWNSQLKQYLENRFFSKQKLTPRVTVTEFSSSSRLIKSTHLINLWKKTARSVRTVEMELAGVYRAARTKNREYPILAIRGISDIVGFKREEAWTSFACYTAAAFTFSLLKTGMIKDSVQEKYIPPVIQLKAGKEQLDHKIDEALLTLEDVKLFFRRNTSFWSDQYELMAKKLWSIQSLIHEVLDAINTITKGNRIERSFNVRRIKQDTRAEIDTLLTHMKKLASNRGGNPPIETEDVNIEQICENLKVLIEKSGSLMSSS